VLIHKDVILLTGIVVILKLIKLLQNSLIYRIQEGDVHNMKRLVIFIAILTVIIFMAGIVPVFAEETNRTVIKHDNSAITYTGNWFTNAQTGDCKRSTTAGEKAELQFTGTGFEIYVNNGTGAGLMKVYVDGQLVATVDTYSPNINLGIKIYRYMKKPI